MILIIINVGILLKQSIIKFNYYKNDHNHLLVSLLQEYDY